MIRALLEGRKTQTRRICKGQRALSNAHDFQLDRCPYGTPGGLLWVRESHYIIGEHRWVHYRADGSNNLRDPSQWTGPWKPSIHMPRWASRLTLRITDVRVQRLKDISVADAKAEGAQHGDFMHPDATVSFQALWKSINGADSWFDNPWVWALTFEVIKQNVDAAP